MILGGGDIAGVLKAVDRDDRIYFASGVSNSGETNHIAFLRERSLLINLLPVNHLVYFSSLSIFYSNTPYALHKRAMERLVRTQFARWTIVRVGNIDWGNNPNTLINYLRARAQRGEKLEIQDTFRYITNRDEFLYWLRMIPDWSCEMNIPGRRLTVAEIVEEYVKPFVEIAA